MKNVLSNIVEKIKTKRSIHYVIIIIIGLLVSVPFFWVQICPSDDGAYHFLRIIGLDFAIKNKIDYAIVRFYQWYPKCISLGCHQKDDCFRDLGIDTVKRVSGGRALLHDKELTYCFVSPIFKESIIESYKEISSALILGFKKLGIELNFAKNENKNLSYCMNISSGADVSYQGKKFIGSAQFRRQGYLLQHGSIPYELDYDLIQKIFSQDVEKEHIITLNEINPNLSTRQIIDALKEGFIEHFEK